MHKRAEIVSHCWGCPANTYRPKHFFAGGVVKVVNFFVVGKIHIGRQAQRVNDNENRPLVVVVEVAVGIVGVQNGRYFPCQKEVQRVLSEKCSCIIKEKPGLAGLF
jgi:hypothetical protein